MKPRARRWSAIASWACALLVAGGCKFAAPRPAPSEPSPASTAAGESVYRLPPPAGHGPAVASHATVCQATGHATSATLGGLPPEEQGPIRLVQGQEPQRDGTLPAPLDVPPPAMGLTLPKNLPGADAPPIVMPSDATPQERSGVIDRLFPKLPGVEAAAPFALTPEGRGLELDDLLAIARANSPLLRQARADIVAARGKAIDVGAYPNPQFGYEMDNAGTLGTAGYQGGLWNQTIKTAGKLRLARAAATVEVRNAELALRKANVDLSTKVQAGYFAVLVAQEWVRVSQALVQFTDEVFRVQVNQLRGGEAAAYEPAQLRVLAMQARAAAVQARNRHIAAWMQLAAAMGVPDMPPTALEGSPDIAAPKVSYPAALQRVLATNTELLAAQNTIAKARYNLRFEQVKPIPDLNTYVAVQKDYTGPPFATTVNLQAFVPVPILYRNQGGILDAQGQLMRATQDVERVRNDLVARLAGAFETYENTRTILAYYRDHILPDQARAYRGVYERHQQQPDQVSFNDIVTTQQTLAANILQYINVLGDQWTAVTTLANIVQVESLAELAEPHEEEAKEE